MLEKVRLGCLVVIYKPTSLKPATKWTKTLRLLLTWCPLSDSLDSLKVRVCSPESRFNSNGYSATCEDYSTRAIFMILGRFSKFCQSKTDERTVYWAVSPAQQSFPIGHWSGGKKVNYSLRDRPSRPQKGKVSGSRWGCWSQSLLHMSDSMEHPWMHHRLIAVGHFEHLVPC